MEIPSQMNIAPVVMLVASPEAHRKMEPPLNLLLHAALVFQTPRPPSGFYETPAH